MGISAKIRLKFIRFSALLLLIGLSLPSGSHAQTKLQEIKKYEVANNPQTREEINRRRVEYDAGDLKDPFRILRFKKEKTAGDETVVVVEESVPPALSIQGIILGKQSQAIVNNTVVKIGDTVSEARVINIHKDGIDVLYKGREYTIDSPSKTDYLKSK